MKQKNIRLLPCPFCGGDAEMIFHNGGLLFKAACAGDRCIGSYIFKWYDTPGQAASAWNERKIKENEAIDHNS